MFSRKLDVKNLTCRRNEQVLFNDLNISLSPENILFLQGHNGSGKTSLLRILCGFRLPDQGEITWNNQSIFSEPEYFKNISYIGHNNGIKDELTVAENLNLMASLASAVNIDTLLVLKEIGLLKQADNLTRILSAGQKRKLALARLMMTNNSFWILDEPFISLDQSAINIFEALIRKHISRGGMLVITSHHNINLTGLSVVKLNLDNSH